MDGVYPYPLPTTHSCALGQALLKRETTVNNLINSLTLAACDVVDDILISNLVHYIQELVKLLPGLPTEH